MSVTESALVCPSRSTVGPVAGGLEARSAADVLDAAERAKAGIAPESSGAAVVSSDPRHATTAAIMASHNTRMASMLRTATRLGQKSAPDTERPTRHTIKEKAANWAEGGDTPQFAAVSTWSNARSNSHFICLLNL